MPPDLSTIKPGHNYASLLNTDPPIVLGWTGLAFPFGSASVIAPLFKRRRIVFLVINKWSLADKDEAEAMAALARPFMAAHPQHRFEWIMNIDEETENLRALGLSAHTHNQNMLIREDIFRPLAGVPRRFDAIYNGRVSPQKRNELAAMIPRVAFIAYRDHGEHTIAAFHAAVAELTRRVPGGRLLNPMTEAGPTRLSPVEVNAAYAESGVGLCLSPREGTMRVSIEYQMAGLPIVGTQMRGGRDHYRDDVTWQIVPPDPQEVRDAVAAVIGRDIPRDVVRKRTMVRIERDRRRFIDFIERIVVEEHGTTTFRDRFQHMLRHSQFERWLSMRDFAAEVWTAVGGDQTDGIHRPPSSWWRG